MPFDDEDAPGTARLYELEAEPALTHTRLADDSDSPSLTLQSSLERGLEELHLRLAAYELRESSGARHFEAGSQPPRRLELENSHRAGETFYLERPEITKREEPGDQPRRALGQIHCFRDLPALPSGLPIPRSRPCAV